MPFFKLVQNYVPVILLFLGFSVNVLQSSYQTGNPIVVMKYTNLYDRY